MTNERSKVWMVILGLFSKIWPFFVPEPELAEAWDFVLADLSEDELVSAARNVMAMQSKQPTPADMRDAVQGKLQWVDVWQRNAWGSVVLGANGAPVSIGREQVRVKPGESAPVLLSWGTPDDKFAHGIEPAKSAELVRHSSIAALVDGLAKRLKPS